MPRPDPSTPSNPQVFDEHLNAWRDWQTSPWGKLRYRIVAQLLARHLPPVGPSVEVLDLGGGDGADSVPLAVAGYAVTVVDSSEGMLERARERAEAAGVSIRSVLEGVEEMTPPGVAGADVVLLHNVVQYAADPERTVAAAVHVTRPGGLVSVIATNPVSHVLRTAVRDLDPAEALKVLDAAEFRTVIFDHAVRRIDWAHGADLLDRAGADVIGRYGVLCVNHLITDDERKYEPRFATELERLELALADRDPYRDIASMWMLIGRRRD